MMWLRGVDSVGTLSRQEGETRCPPDLGRHPGYEAGVSPGVPTHSTLAVCVHGRGSPSFLKGFFLLLAEYCPLHCFRENSFLASFLCRKCLVPLFAFKLSS